MVLICSLLLLISQPASALPYVLDASFATWGTVQGNVPNATLILGAGDLWDVGDLFAPSTQQIYPTGFLLLGGEVEFSSYARMHALLDSGAVQPGSTLHPPLDAALTSNGQSMGAFFKSGAIIRELELVVGHPGWRVGLGKRRRALGHGLVYDDYAWGVDVALRGDKFQAGPWAAEAGFLVLPVSLQVQTPRNPFAFASLAYTPSFFESIEVFVAYFDDRAAALNDVLTSAVAENLIVQNASNLQQQLDRLFLRTRQQLGAVKYLGASFDLLPWAAVSWRGTAVVQRGSMFVPQAGDRDLALNLHGWAADTAVAYEVAPYLSVGLLGFAQSGSRSPSTQTASSNYGSFIGVAPFLTYSNLFFSGGLNEGFFAGRATSSGFNGHGVGGVGATASYGGLGGHVEARAVYLAALASAPAAPVAGGGSSYGIEYDLVGLWSPTSWLSVGGEADLLQPGDFFPQSTLAYRLLAQVYVYGGT